MRLACTACSATSGIDFPGWRCPVCGSPLEISTPRHPMKMSDLIAKERVGM